MMIQKIKRMIEISRPLLAFDHWPRFYRFSRGLELSLLKVLSRKIFLIILPPTGGCCTLSILSWILMWKVGPAEVLVAESALKVCAKWPGRIPRWTKQTELYQLEGKALALS